MKTRYKFSHRARGVYYWISTTKVGPRDSRHEQIRCGVKWFWAAP